MANERAGEREQAQRMSESIKYIEQKGEGVFPQRNSVQRKIVKDNAMLFTKWFSNSTHSHQILQFYGLRQIKVVLKRSFSLFLRQKKLLFSIQEVHNTVGS